MVFRSVRIYFVVAYSALNLACTANFESLRDSLTLEPDNSGSPETVVEPDPGIFTLSKTTMTISRNWTSKGKSSIVTLSTRDQYGELIYEPSRTVSFSSSGGTSKGWFSDVTDNGDGTYVVEFYGMIEGSSTSLNASIDALPSPTSVSIQVIAPRLSYTGASERSSAVSARIFDETDGGFLLTGNCDVEFGNVSIGGILPVSYTTPCLSTGGGTFSVYINYDTTEPYFISGARPMVLEISQGVQAPQFTTLYKTTSGSPPTIITNLAGLQGITCNDNSVYYILGDDIDVVAWSGGVTVNNWVPICNIGSFEGIFDGNYRTISGIHRSSASNFNGFFGQTSGARLSNIYLDQIVIVGQSSTGGVAGRTSLSDTLVNLHVTNGSITGTTYVGGISGDSGSKIYYSSFEGQINGDNYVGGIVGDGFGGQVSYSRVNGNVIGTNGNVGGIVGRANSGFFSYNSTSGTVSGQTLVGGIAGMIDSPTRFKDCFSDAAISGNQYVGGIWGYSGGADLWYGPKNVYFSGSINVATTNAGPIAGDSVNYLIDPPENNFYLSGLACTNCDTFILNDAKTSSQLKNQATFLNFDFLKFWVIDEGVSNPQLVPLFPAATEPSS